MTKIKVGDRVRFLLSGLEAVILRIDEKDNSFQVIVRGVWYKFNLVELAEPVQTKLIPFQADKWTPEQKVVTRTKLLPVRILCVDADDDYFPVVGLIENSVRGGWTNRGFFRLDEIDDHNDLMVVVEPKTKTLYGYWVLGFKGHIFGSKKERDECFDFFAAKDGDHIRIKFQTEIEL